MLQGVISESALWTTSKKLVSRSFGAKPPCQDLMKITKSQTKLRKSKWPYGFMGLWRKKWSGWVMDGWIPLRLLRLLEHLRC